MWWIVALIVLAFPISFFLDRRLRRRALVIVHPWNAGFDADEITQKMKTMTRQIRIMSSHEIFFTRNARENIISRHLEYYEVSIRFLKNAYYGHYILFEECGNENRMLDKLKSVLKDNLMFRLGTRFAPKVSVIRTVNGRSTPIDSDWNEVANNLYQRGIREIAVVGCYLGLENEEPVYNPKVYGHYGVNEAYFFLAVNQHFKKDKVSIIPLACYDHQAEKAEERAPRFSGNRTKRKRKKE